MGSPYEEPARTAGTILNVQIEGEMETTESPEEASPAGSSPAGSWPVGPSAVSEQPEARPGGAVVDTSPRPDDAPDPEESVEAVDRLLDEVEQALSRLDDGTYGQCEVCGGPIDDSRLAGDPTVRECGNCPESAAG
jgi:RNA polymerase-binding transcription factor DksA